MLSSLLQSLVRESRNARAEDHIVAEIHTELFFQFVFDVNFTKQPKPSFLSAARVFSMASV